MKPCRLQECHHRLYAVPIKGSKTLKVAVLCAGLPIRAVQWGAWHGVGMVAENDAVLKRMRRGGIQTLSPIMGLGALQKLLSGSNLAAQVCRSTRH